MTEPMSREERQALIDAPHYVDGWQVTDAQAQRLLDIAEDHARLRRWIAIDDSKAWIDAVGRLGLERDALRAELARIRAHIESSHNEVTCSQDARHANDGDDRVPMLTCMTLEAHTLRAENTKLRERGDKFRDLEAQAAEHVEVQLLNRTDFDPDGEIVGWPGLGLALNRALDERDKLRERVGKLEAVERAARKAWGMAAFPDVNYGLSDALAALDEEDAK